jgi:membrane protein EpsK
MQAESEAKKRLLVNVFTNILVVFVNAAISIWLIPYLIKHLGLGLYGMIALVISFIAYFDLFTRSIANSVTRFVAIHLGRDEIEKSNLYFNSALSALTVLCGILLVPVVIIALLFSRIFQVPAGFEADTSWLFFLVLLSSFIMSVTSPFIASAFIRHRFDLSNSVDILSRFLRVAVIVLCFTYLSPSLKYFGLSYLSMAIFFLVCSVMLARWLTPQLRVNRKLFDWGAFRQMTRMSAWITVNQVGILLYLGTSLIIINLFLGPEQVGRYAPVAQWVTLLVALAGSISNVFTPIAYEYIAREQTAVLAIQIRRSVKFMVLIMGLPVGLLCGLAQPILRWWLPSFTDLWPLVWLLIAPLLVTVAVRPMGSIHRGLDKVKVPALVTFIIGIINVLLSIALVHYTNLGIYGVALALSLCFAGKNLFFTPIYTAIITNQPKTSFIKETIPGFLMAALLSLGALALSRTYDLASLPRLSVVAVVAALIYGVLSYQIILTQEDRTLLWSLVLRQK